MSNIDWITDRQPTAADGDHDGDVRVEARINESSDAVQALAHWSLVKTGTPWSRTCCWAPSAEYVSAPEHQPEPEPPAKPDFKPEPVVTPPAAEIPEPIRTGAAPFYVVVVSDDSGGAGGGNPMVAETQIPEGSTLRAALEQRARIGHRYGATYVAECRIIPELTREAPVDA